jgi:hypothetical protein
MVALTLSFAARLAEKQLFRHNFAMAAGPRNLL